MSTEVNSPIEDSTLSSKQLHAIRLIITGGKLKQQIAEEVGIVPETLSRWQQMPAFIAELNKARLDAYEATLQGIHNLNLSALATFKKLLNSKNEKIRQTTALALLRVHFELAKPSGPTTIEDVLAQQERDDAHRKLHSDMTKLIRGEDSLY